LKDGREGDQVAALAVVEGTAALGGAQNKEIRATL
jgi:hypothetical protein